MTAYVALLRKEADSDFGIDFPDFAGCVAVGIAVQEAATMAAEALALHIEGMLADGEAVPKPSKLDKIMSDPHHADAVPILISLPIRRMKAARKKPLPTA